MSDLRVLPTAPPLAASNLDDLLREADFMLAFVTSGSLPTVARLADALVGSARGVGATKISEAADRLRQAASGHDQVALTRPMLQPAEAVSEERRTPRGGNV